MLIILNVSFVGGLFKFEMFCNIYYGNYLFMIWCKGWKYVIVVFRNFVCIFFCCFIGKKIYKYIIFYKKNEK